MHEEVVSTPAWTNPQLWVFLYVFLFLFLWMIRRLLCLYQSVWETVLVEGIVQINDQFGKVAGFAEPNLVLDELKINGLVCI